MVNSPAASEAPLSEVGGPAPSDVTWNYIDSVSAVGMPEPQAAFPAGFQQYNHYQPLQMGGSDPNALQLSHVIWELQQQQQMNVQLMQQMTMVQQHVFGHGQQSSASPQVAPRKPRNNKASRPWMEQRKRRKQAQSAAAASQAGQGVAGGSIGATEPQCKSDADSWEMPEVEPEGALKKVTEEMEEHRKQLGHLSQVVSALREDMDERFVKKDAAVEQFASVHSLDAERQARMHSMEAMTERMATTDRVDEQLRQLQRATEAMATTERVNEQVRQLDERATTARMDAMATTERVNEQVRQLDERATTARMDAMASTERVNEQVRQLRRDATARMDAMATTEWVNEQVGQLWRDATARMDAMATTEWVNEQVGQLWRDASARMDAMTEEMATETELQEERMATTRWVNEELRQLQREATARMTAVQDQVKTAQTTAVKMTTIDGQPVDVRDVRKKLMRFHPHDFDVFVYHYSLVDPNSGFATSAEDIQLVLHDGSLVGQPAKKAVNWIWSPSRGLWELEDPAGLRRLVLEHLARNGLEYICWSECWTYVTDTTARRLVSSQFPMSGNSRGSLAVFQEFLRRSRESDTRITEADVARAESMAQNESNSN